MIVQDLYGPAPGSFFVFPNLIQAGKGEGFTGGRADEVRLLASGFSRPLKKPLAGIRHRRCFKAALKAGLEDKVSTRALIILEPMEISLAQKGTNPQCRF